MSKPTPRKRHDDMDFDKPHNRVVSQNPVNKACFSQDFKLYTGTGEYLREMPAACRPKKKEAVRTPVGRNASSTDRPQTAREAAIAKLGNTDPVPKSIKDARKENRAAAAAEANAE